MAYPRNGRRRTAFISRKFFVLSIITALVVPVLLHRSGYFIPSSRAVSTTVVISQVYGGGGNAGSTYRQDFIELFNRGTSPQSLNGWSVQYASATGTSWQKTDLTNVTLQPGQYYLVRQAQGAGGTTDLPTADVTGAPVIAMSATAGKVVLLNTTTLIASGTSCPSGSVVDIVGFGTTANCFEGSGPTPAPSNTIAVLRASNGCTDTDQNATDFSAGAPTPRNTASTFSPCGPALPNLSISDVSQAETNAGTTTFTFAVTLSAPAGLGGVTFDIATADGTAQDDNPAVSEDNDYVGQSLTAQNIPMGSTGPYNFNVTVNGDVIPETNETFFVDVSNVTGATVTDGQGQGTIQNDDAECASLSITDVAEVETDAGTTTFAFTVSLSQAGCGSVTFDIATADGTAQDDNPPADDNDYVPQSLTGQTITFPSTYTFNVTVNGDTTTEPDQTFFVNITNVSPANVQVADGQGLGTIVNDDFTRIHDIQGPGASSPLSGVVTTRGIVTGRKSNGFFIQEPDASVDADPATSEGIFVFTSSAPPAAAAVGSLVEVTGTISEFVPSADPLQPPLTELTSPTTAQISTGNPLPAAIPVTATFPDPAGAHDQLERLEGMRVSVSSLTVVGPTLGNINEASATATSSGVFYGVVTGVARPFREAGIPAPDPAPSGGGTIPPIPRFDSNPERIRVDSDSLTGAPILDVGAGATVTGLVGPLDYTFRSYTVYPDPTLPAPIATGGPTATAVTAATTQEFTVASFNMHRFFDTVNDPGIGEPVLTATAYDNRLNKASLAIRNFLLFPDIIGVQEVENLSALQSLATRINNDAVANSQPDPNYVAYLVEGNDIGGIDVGFLVKTAFVTGITERVAVNAVVQELDGTLFVNADSSIETLHDRPPLRLDAVINHANGTSFAVTVINNHLRSLGDVNAETPGSNGWATDGARVRAKRQKQAEDLANLVQARQTNDPTEHIILVGDFNAFEVNDGLGHSMGVIAGTPVPDNETAVPGDGVDLVNPDLDNLFDSPPADQRYSYVFDGNAQNLDHVLVNQPLITDTAALRLEHARINADFAETARNNSANAVRLSDHDPAVAYFNTTLADVSITKTLDTSGPYTVGQTITYTLNVVNAGPSAATNIQVTDTPTNLTITNVSGSGCAALPCTIASLAASANTTITVTATLDAPGAFDNSATATAAEFDPSTSNNSDTTGNGGTTAALPTLAIDDVTLAEGNSGTTAFVFTVTKTGAGAAIVQFTTNSGSATLADNDYQPNSNSLSFASSDTTKQITVLVNGDTAPEANETFAVDLSSPSGATITDGSGLGTINNDDQSANSGDVIISEFRFRGPGTVGGPLAALSQKIGKTGIKAPELIGPVNQSEDEFIEIYNNTNSDITVSTTDGSAGWAVVAADGVTRFIIPNNTVILARGHFLGVNTDGYSLANYGGPGAAAGNLILLADGVTPAPGYTQDIPDGSGIALFRSANSANFTLAERLDAAGYAGVDPLYREGTGFPTGGAETTGGLEHTFFRTMTRATSGIPKDTGDNTADFFLADTAGTDFDPGAGTTQRLGAPGPENLSSPINRTAQFGYALLDPALSAESVPNRERNPTPLVTNGLFGTLTIRRTFTNNTGATLNRLRFRIVEVTTFPSPVGSGLADLRALTSIDETACVGGGTPPVCMGGTSVVVRGTTLEELPPSQSMGGGWNASLNVPNIGSPPMAEAAGKVSYDTPTTGTIVLSAPLNNGEAINVQFKLGVMQTGRYFFYLNIEATPGLVLMP